MGDTCTGIGGMDASGQAKTDRPIRNPSGWATLRLCEVVGGEISACDGRPERLEDRLNKERD
jgi:hypothetical protein